MASKKTKEREVEKWITVRGKHVPVYKDTVEKPKYKENIAYAKEVIRNAKKVLQHFVKCRLLIYGV